MTSVTRSEHPHIGSEKILVFVPMYNCAQQIARVLRQFNEQVQSYIAKIIIIDNQSSDQGIEIAKLAAQKLRSIDVEILRNTQNFGLGGSHKVAFNYAIDHGFDYIIVLHGDDQGSITDIIPLLDQQLHHAVDCLLGARFMRGSRLRGYSAFRTFGNRVFNLLYSAAAKKRLLDLGSGLNLYAVDALVDRSWLTFPDDLTFNYYMVLASAAKNWRMQFFALTWREEDQRSNVKLFRQAWKVVAILWTFTIARSRFLTADWRVDPDRTYTATMVYAHVASRRDQAGELA
ncbi:MAG TPA: glycosyltransferase family 2 protein [Dongiaceae bacterium]